MAVQTPRASDEPRSQLNSGPSLVRGKPSEPKITLQDLPPRHELEDKWRELEARSRGSFFTSWGWIGPWLACLPPECNARLLSYEQDGRLLGLAVVVERQDRRFGFLPVRSSHVHATGRVDCDAITIEYNGFLVDRTAGSEVEAAMLSRIMMGNDAPDELRLPGCSALPSALPLSLHVRHNEHLGFYVDLEAINASGGDYLGFLKQRSRYLVRKSLKRLSDPAPLRLVVADSVPMALQYMGELQRLHTAYWQARGEPGAFGNEFQRRFHTHVLNQGVPEGRVVLLALYQGDVAVGYFYCLCHDGWVHYYQSGIDYERLDGSVSPGLAGHAMAIEHFRSAGWRVYDFMTGDKQFKRTLCTHTLPLFWVVVQQRSAKMRLEDGLLTLGRAARARWRQWQTRARPGSSAARLAQETAPEASPSRTNG